MSNNVYKNAIVTLSGLTALAGFFLLVDYFSHLDNYEPDPFWVFNTAVQIALIGFSIYFVLNSRIKLAFGFYIAVIASEVIGRIQSTVEAATNYPEIENIELTSIPIIGDLVVPYEYPSPYDAALSWFAQITAASELVVLALLIVLLVKEKQSNVGVENSCSNCGSTEQTGKFCSKCGSPTK